MVTKYSGTGVVWEGVKQPSRYLLKTDISPLAAGLLGDLGDRVGVYYAKSGENNAEGHSGCLRQYLLGWTQSGIFTPSTAHSYILS